MGERRGAVNQDTSAEIRRRIDRLHEEDIRFFRLLRSRSAHCSSKLGAVRDKQRVRTRELELMPEMQK